MFLAVKNWAEFQHYKDRSPPWIKLHKALLDDRAFQRLPDASRALAPCLWLLASEAKDGIFNGAVEEVAFRVRQSEAWVDKAIKPLISSGFLIVVQDASKLLAPREQVAVPETEAETEKRESSRKRARTRCPIEFAVNEAMADWAESKGLPGDRIIPETEKFLAHHRAKDSLFKDWYQAWQSWIFKAVEFGGFKPRVITSDNKLGAMT